MLKSAATLALAGLLLSGSGLPAFAQAGSPNSCQALETSNPAAYAQLCAGGSRQLPDATDPVLGDDTPDDAKPPCPVRFFLPEDFRAGERIHLAC